MNGYSSQNSWVSLPSATFVDNFSSHLLEKSKLKSWKMIKQQARTNVFQEHSTHIQFLFKIMSFLTKRGRFIIF
jgi:hypothetical protein